MNCDGVGKSSLESIAFQKLAISFHQKMNDIRHTTVSEIVKQNPEKISIRRIIDRIIESGKDFINNK